MPQTSTILVVDDMPAMHQLIATLLGKYGYHLEFASNGAEALSKAEALSPDLVLLDIMMPVMDGYEVCRRLRAAPRLAEIPIIMVTALGDRASRLKGLEAGADDFVTKPFDQSELGARVRAIIRLNRYRRLLAERARFERLIELSPDGIMIVDSHGLVRLANPSMRLMLGVDDESQVIDQPMMTFVESSHHKQCGELFGRQGSSQQPQHIESLFVRRNGSAFPVEIHSGQFDWNDLPMVQVVVRDITERKLAEEALHQRNRELALLNHASHVFGASLDIEHVLSSILDETRLLFGVAGSSIWLVEDATGDLVCWQATGQGNHELRNGRLEPGEGLAGWTFTMGEPLLVPDAQVDERHSRAIDQLTGLPHRAVLSVPLVSKSDVFGVLQLVDTVPGRFELSELRMAESLASIAAIAIENALLFRAVNQQRGQLRALTVRLGEVQETERQQLAGELHDRIGQNLTALNLNLTIIDQLLPADISPVVHRRIEDSIGILGETARRVRNVMAELRPPMLDDYGLLPALRWVGEQFVTRTGIAVRVDGPATESRLPLRLETALFRIAQEALNNVAKHARAHEVRITFEPTDRRVRLSIADDGVGFDVMAAQRNVDTPHWGMLTMQERAASMGGTVRLDSAPGLGTRVVVEIEMQRL